MLSTPTGSVATQLIKRKRKSSAGAADEIRSLAISLNEDESELLGLSKYNQAASGKHKEQLLRTVHMGGTGSNGDMWWHSGDASHVAGRTWSISLPNVTITEYSTKAAAMEATASGAAGNAAGAAGGGGAGPS